MASLKRTVAIASHVQPPPARSEVGACGSCNTPRRRGQRRFMPSQCSSVQHATAAPAVGEHATVAPAVGEHATVAPAAGGYDWQGVHADLEAGVYAGSYGWDNAAYWGISELKAGIDLKEWYKTRTEAEFYLPEFKELIDHPETQKDWGNIVTFDPLGMYAHPPTIAACKAHLDIVELYDLEKDGKIVTDSGIVTAKCAVYYAWNLPSLASRLDLSEEELRGALYKYSHDERLLDPKVKTFIPAVGGCTVYTFGDARKLRDPRTETVVRVHDECIGSDVFGSDICSCRPYLIFALRQAVECAQRGGVGVVVYFRKEGRSLGEVIKFRVYNARINQMGGDRADTYFHHTESIAGIRDARFQTMMPDVLNWMGIRRIDWLCSMSNEKYEAITGAGIQVMQRVDLPEDYIKASMRVELDAKIASGYHSDTLDRDQVASELMQLAAVRHQCGRIYDLGKEGNLSFFDVDETKMHLAVEATEASLRKRYPSLKVPMHSRLRHMEQADVARLMSSWRCDETEKARRLVDLVVVSVLLDAGAGQNWHYITADGNSLRASEGLARASMDMFLDGAFSSDAAVKTRVNSLALKHTTEASLARGFQVSSANPLIGLSGRTRLLRSLGEALEQSPQYFGEELCRPGNLVDYLLSHAEAGKVGLEHLWRACSEGLYSIWPLQPNGILRGDIWAHTKLQVSGKPGSDLVPFHKLTQWLIYSIIDALDLSLGLKVTGLDMLTGLPEYRNGGLFLDSGVLLLKDPSWLSQEVNVGTELIVEWRALTVVLLDKLAEQMRKKLQMGLEELPMTAVLEGGTWHAGRELAKSQRSDGSPPIRIRLDGTVF